MGIIKERGFTADDRQMAMDAKALAHPARIAILKLLLQKQTCICGDIVSELPLSQSTISQHLKELKNAGFIKGEVEGVTVCYCINPDKWNQVKEQFAHFFSKPEFQAEGCCRHTAKNIES